MRIHRPAIFQIFLSHPSALEPVGGVNVTISWIVSLTSLTATARRTIVSTRRQLSHCLLQHCRDVLLETCEVRGELLVWKRRMVQHLPELGAKLSR